MMMPPPFMPLPHMSRPWSSGPVDPAVPCAVCGRFNRLIIAAERMGNYEQADVYRKAQIAHQAKDHWGAR